MSNHTNHRKLGVLAAISLVVGNMIGSGIFLLPASLAAFGGISIIGWIIASLGAIALAIVFSVLTERYPQTGGPYIYARAGFGDFAGFLVAWGYWISVCATNAAITIAMLSYLQVFFPFLATSKVTSAAIGFTAIWGLSFVNMRGIYSAGIVQVVTTIMKVIPLILVTVIGVFYIDWSYFSPFNISGLSDWEAIVQTTALTLFAFLGVECATIPAESIKDNRTVKQATIWGTMIAIIIYIGSSVVILGLMPAEELVNSSAPFADGAFTVFGETGRLVVAFGAVVSTFGALNGWILVSGQIPLAAAKDKMFHRLFQNVNDNGSPAKGIVMSSILVTLFLMLQFDEGLNKAFEFLILLSTLTVLIPYLFSSITYILLYKKETHKVKALLIGTFAFIFSLFAIYGCGKEIVFYGFLFLMASLPIYAVIKWKETP